MFLWHVMVLFTYSRSRLRIKIDIKVQNWVEELLTRLVKLSIDYIKLCINAQLLKYYIHVSISHASSNQMLTSCILLSSEFMIRILSTNFSALSSLKIQLRSSPKPTRRQQTHWQHTTVSSHCINIHCLLLYKNLFSFIHLVLVYFLSLKQCFPAVWRVRWATSLFL